MAERIGVSKTTIERELSKSKDIHFVGAIENGTQGYNFYKGRLASFLRH